MCIYIHGHVSPACVWHFYYAKSIKQSLTHSLTHSPPNVRSCPFWHWQAMSTSLTACLHRRQHKCMAKEKHWRAQQRPGFRVRGSRGRAGQRRTKRGRPPKGWPKYFTDCVQTSIQSWCWRRRRRRHSPTIFGDCTRCKVSTDGSKASKMGQEPGKV